MPPAPSGSRTSNGPKCAPETRAIGAEPNTWSRRRFASSKRQGRLQKTANQRHDRVRPITEVLGAEITSRFPKVIVEPREHLPHQIVTDFGHRHRMARLEDDVTLLSGHGAQSLVHWLLRRRDGENRIVGAVYHEHRDMYAREEIDGIDLRQLAEE